MSELEDNVRVEIDCIQACRYVLFGRFSVSCISASDLAFISVLYYHLMVALASGTFLVPINISEINVHRRDAGCILNSTGFESFLNT